MRKIAIILGLVLLAATASAQTTNPFPTTDSLRKFVNKWIRNSAVDAFTNLRLNTALIGVTRFIDDAEGGGGGGIAPSDTAAMLSGYTRLSRFMDSVAALRAAISGAGAGPAGPENSLQYRSGGIFAGDAGLTYNATTNALLVDSSVSVKVRSNSVQLNEFAILPLPNRYNSFGDSFTAGLYASVVDSQYNSRLGRSWNLSLTNYGVSGTGAWKAAQLNLLNTQPGHRAIETVMAGFNDVRYNGIARPTLNEIINGHKSIYFNHFLKSWVAGGSASATRFGAGWLTTYLSQSVGGKSFNNGAYTSTAGDSITYTFTDSTWGWGAIGGDNSDAGHAMSDSTDVYLDNVFVERVNLNRQFDGVNGDGRGPMAFIYRVPYGTHKAKIVNRHAGNFLVVDYFGHLVDSAQAYPLIFMKPAYNNVAGFAVAPSNGSVAKMDTVAVKLDSLKTALGNTWSLIVVNPNTNLDTLNGFGSDKIHPNDLGMRQIATSVLNGFSFSSFYGGNVDNGNIRYLSKKLYVDVDAVRKEVPYKDDVVNLVDTNWFVINQRAYTQTANFDISDTGKVRKKLLVGSSAMNNAPVLQTILGSDNMIEHMGNGGVAEIAAYNLARTATNELRVKGNPFRLGVTASSVFTPLFVMDNAASDKFVLSGNTTINSTVNLGNALSSGINRPITLGMVSGLPYLGFFRSTSTSGKKFWDMYADDNIHFRLNADNGLTGSDWLTVYRNSSNGADSIVANGKIRLNGTPLGASNMKFLMKGSDSVVYQLDASSLPAPALTTNYIGVGASNLLSGSSAYQYNGTNVTQSNSAARNYIVNTDALGSTSGGSISLYNDGTPSASSQSLGNLEFGARISGNYRLGGSIRALSSGAWTDGSVYRTDLIFSVTASGSATPSVGMRLNGGSRLYVGGNTVASATLHLAGGSAGASGAPLKFTSGTNQTTPEAGAMEYDGTSFFATPGSTRLRKVLTDNSIPSNGQIPIGNGANYTNATITGGSTISVTNGAGSITLAVPTTFITSGTYTPTITNGSNVAGSTAYVCQYMRVGDVVTVSGRIDIDPTLTATSTQLTITLPIASSLSGSNQAGGTAFCPNVAGLGMAIMSDGVSQALFQCVSSDINNNPFSFSFQYRIQ